MGAIAKNLIPALLERAKGMPRPELLVKVGRAWYWTSATVILAAWYTGWRNQRVPHDTPKLARLADIPIPGLDRRRKRYSASVADTPEEPADAEGINIDGAKGLPRQPEPLGPAVPGGQGTLGGALGANLAASNVGGEWQGSKRVANALAQIGFRNGLRSVSEKRPTRGTASGGRSDHWTGSTDSYAYDLSNGARPTPEMDRSARQIISALGGRYVTGELVYTVVKGNFRIQVLYRTQVGGNHDDHIHVGVRRVG